MLYISSMQTFVFFKKGSAEYFRLQFDDFHHMCRQFGYLFNNLHKKKKNKEQTRTNFVLSETISYREKLLSMNV